MALTIHPGSGQLCFFLAREAKELGQSMVLAYDAASSVDSYNSKLDQMIYSPCLCSSSLIRDVINWLYNGVRGLTETTSQHICKSDGGNEANSQLSSASHY